MTNILNRTILHGDILHKLKEINDNTIDTIISSPPYWNLRDYHQDGQIGLEPEFTDYLKKMAEIMVQLKRVLKKTGSCWINLGDTYSTKKSPLIMEKSRLAIPERFYVNCIDNGWIARNNIVWYKSNSIPHSVKNRFTNKWESLFFFVKNNKNIYYYNENTSKSQTIPSKKGGLDWKYIKCEICNGTGKIISGETHKTCKGNGILRYSYWHGIQYYFNINAVKENALSSSKPFNIRVRESTTGCTQLKFGQITGKTSTKDELSMYDKSGIRKETNNKYIKNLPESNGARININSEKIKNKFINDKQQTRQPGDVFFINPESFSESHFATFPVSLPLHILKCACPSEVCDNCGLPRYPVHKTIHNDTNDSKVIGFSKCECNDSFHPGIVLDPFFGAGTVGVAAEKLGLNWCGIEINGKYIDIAKKRLSKYTTQERLMA